MPSLRATLIALALAGVSGNASACFSIAATSPESVLKDPRSAVVFLGTVVHISKPEKLTVRVTESLKGNATGEVTISTLWFFRVRGSCGPEIPALGMNVIVVLNRPDSQIGDFAPLEPGAPFAMELRAVRQRMQSNPTPHADARDVPESAAEGAARAGERER